MGLRGLLAGGFPAVMLGVALCAASVQPALAVERERVAVELTAVEAGAVRDELWSYGTLEPKALVKISPQTAGTIDAILFKAGERVAAGQPLIKQDDRIARARVDAAKAKADLDAANLQRATQLSSRGLQTLASLEEARANVAASSSSLQVEQTQLELLTLNAPFDGLVGPADFDRGAYVAPGQSIVQFEDRSTLRLIFRLSETVLPRLRLGQHFTAMAKSLGDRVLDGTIVYFDPGIEPTSRSVQMRGEIANADYAVPPGLFVSVRLVLGQRADALLVPETAVLTTLAGPYVYKVEDGVAHRVPITTGVHQDGRTEVLSGLKAGDQVVTVGQFKLEDGTPVQVRTAATDTGK